MSFEEIPPWEPLPPKVPYIDELKQAIHAVYKHPDKDSRSQAETWLLQQRNLPTAWHVSWTLLQPDCTVEEQYFGAHFLHHQISQRWALINIDHFQRLLQTLFQKLVDYKKGPTIVRTRLLVAVASFVLHSLQGPWPGAIMHAVSYLRQLGAHDLALHILVLIPEEFSSLTLTAQSRGTIRIQASEAVGEVLQFVGECQENPELKETAMKAFSSWVTFELPVERACPILEKMFVEISNPALFDLVVDCTVNFLRQPSALSYPNTIWQVIGMVAQLQRTLGEAIQSDDMSTCQGICQILLAITETYTKLLLNTSREDRIALVQCLISMVLECTGVQGHYPVDESFSDTTLQFWFNFGDDIVSEEADHSKRLLVMYGSVFKKLTEILIRKIAYPSDNDWQMWSEDQRAEFESYRKEVGDTILFVHSFVPDCISILVGEYMSCRTLGTSWQKIEATLYMFRSVAETIHDSSTTSKEETTDSTKIISAVIESLPSLPEHPKIARTALLLCGAYSEWLRNHTDQLLPAVRVLLASVNDPNLSPSAVMAFRDLCIECTDVLATEIIALSESFPAVYGNPQIKNREKIRLCWSLCTLSSELPITDLYQYLKQLLSPSLEQLHHYAQIEPQKELNPKLRLEIGIVNAAFHGVNIPQTWPEPLLQLLNEIWDTLRSILAKWAHDDVIIEELTNFYSRAINTLGPLFDPHLDALLSMLCECYDHHQHACLLESGAQGLVNIYGQKRPEVIAAMMQRLSNTTFGLFTRSMSDHPDLVQAFFSLHLTALRCAPEIVYRPESNCRAVLRAAMAAITMQEGVRTSERSSRVTGKKTLGTSWQKIEATLYMFRSVAETIHDSSTTSKEETTDSTKIISAVIESLPSLPEHPKIARTALLLCGAYSEWLRNHTDQLLPAVRVLLASVNDPNLSPSAVMAFRDLCIECTDVLATEIIALSESFPAVYGNPQIKNREKIRLCWSLCTLSSELPITDLYQYLKQLLSPSLEQLHHYAQIEPQKELKPKLRLEIGIVNAAFHGVNIPQTWPEPLLQLLNEIWDTLRSILAKWAHDDVIIEELTNFYSRAINTLGPLFDPHLDALLSMLCECYDHHQHACLLESGAQGLVNIYGQKRPEVIAAMMQRLSNTTFGLFTRSMSDHPDLVQAFFSLHLTALRCAPEIVYRPESNCRAVLRAAMAAITMQEYHTVKEVSRWMVQFISHYSLNEEVADAISSQFKLLVVELVRGIGTAAPSSTVEFLGDVFVPLCRSCPDLLRETLNSILSEADFPSKHISREEKDRFASSVMRFSHQKRKLKTLIKEFSLVCRGYNVQAVR
eukprot:sb/3461061/